MANISEQKNFQRKCRIDEILKLLKDLELENKIVTDEKEFIYQICDNYSVTERKAKEYINLARYKLKHEKNIEQKKDYEMPNLQ